MHANEIRIRDLPFEAGSLLELCKFPEYPTLELANVLHNNFGGKVLLIDMEREVRYSLFRKGILTPPNYITLYEFYALDDVFVLLSCIDIKDRNFLIINRLCSLFRKEPLGRSKNQLYELLRNLREMIQKNGNISAIAINEYVPVRMAGVTHGYMPAFSSYTYGMMDKRFLSYGRKGSDHLYCVQVRERKPILSIDL